MKRGSGQLLMSRCQICHLLWMAMSQKEGLKFSFGAERRGDGVEFQHAGNRTCMLLWPCEVSNKTCILFDEGVELSLVGVVCKGFTLCARRWTDPCRGRMTDEAKIGQNPSPNEALVVRWPMCGERPHMIGDPNRECRARGAQARCRAIPRAR